MRRRTFLHHAARGFAAATLASYPLSKRLLALPPLDKKFSASDRVTLGRTGITTSRLAMGTGTVGVGHHSHQTDWVLPDSPSSFSTATIKACIFLIPQILTAAIRTLRKP